MAINSKSTKAEILAAYKELTQQNKKLESKIKSSATNNSSPSPAIKQPTATPVPSPAVIIKSHQIDSTIQSLEQIQENFGSAVSNLSENLIAEATELATLQKAIAQEKQELENLYQLTDIDEASLDDLLAEYQVLAREYEGEWKQEQTTAHQEVETLKQAWSKEQKTHARLIAARDEEYRKNQQREEDEYQYNLDLQRDLDELEYEQDKKQRQQKLGADRQLLEQQWQEKETAIAQQEQEYAAAAAKVAAFAEQSRSQVKRGSEEGKGIGSYQARVKADLRAKEIEGETQNYQLRIESLEQTIEHQVARIAKLSQQLDSSLQQVQHLAVKALEGKSQRNSFEAVKAIAIEQAKTSPKGK